MEREFVQEGMNKYVKYSGDGHETVSDRMFSYQNIPGFLPAEITWVNGEKQYIYDITGKISLENYLPGIDVEQVKKIMVQIFELPEQLGDYLLDINGALIDGEDLYVDPRTEELYAVYLPDESRYNMAAIARLIEFIMEKVNQQNQELMFFLYELHRLTIEGGTTCQILKMYMEEYQGEISKKNPEWQEKEGKMYQRKIQDEKRVERKMKQQKGEGNVFLLPGAFLFLGIAIPVVLWYCDWFSFPVSGGTDWVMTAGAFVFFMGVSGYGAWKTWPEQKRMDVKWDMDDTREVCLIPCQGKEEPIPISYFPFVVGSDRERADGILLTKGIGAMHAQFSMEGESIFVMDEESDYGTYYNDERMVPWQKRLLRDGDLLRFGQSEYVVEITEKPCAL